ncbi:imidazoleglycerol-phosphate dehydratase HisB [Candidatus Sumerlaeota bacterium]|nr:imidazoleglycerol-phosphate dehydratase HisB [Candidatus Sumerlaeota bacterium]
MKKNQQKEPRRAEIQRKTKETEISIAINLDGEGKFEGSLGLPFFEHMLELFSAHSLIDINISGRGDLEVDWHHTVEDVGICFGKAFLTAIGDKKGIERYGSAFVPMEETLAHCVVDICDRPFLKFDVSYPRERVGNYDAELTEEFFRAVAMNARITLHFRLFYGTNLHHIHEALFKSAGLALRRALQHNPRIKSIPSTKGIL